MSLLLQLLPNFSQIHQLTCLHTLHTCWFSLPLPSCSHNMPLRVPPLLLLLLRALRPHPYNTIIKTTAGSASTPI
jgi:hypothetical protein